MHDIDLVAAFYLRVIIDNTYRTYCIIYGVINSVVHRPQAKGEAIFEFGRGFYGNTYTPVLSDLTLTPGRQQILCNCKRSTAESWAGSWNEADLHVQQL